VVALLASTAQGQKKGDPVSAANAKSLSLVGNPAPEFSLRGLKEETFDLADRRGDIVVLAFWATWCPPCRSEMPGFAKLQKDLAPGGVAVVPIANDDAAKALDFLTRKKLDVWSLVDSGNTVSKLYGANALPKTFILDRDGIVVKAIVGKVSEADVLAAIQIARQPR
jgi:peroxiredoxin